MRRVQITIFAEETQQVLTYCVCVCMCVCVRGRSYAARKAHSLYYIVFCACPAPPYFSTLSPKRHDFRKKFIEHKMIWFSLQHLPGPFLIVTKNSARLYRKCTQVFMLSTRYACRILMQLEFSRQIFDKKKKKKLKCQISSKSSQWQPSYSVRTDRRAGRQADIRKLQSLFAILWTRLKWAKNVVQLVQIPWLWSCSRNNAC
jgi:hypothetical protein